MCVVNYLVLTKKPEKSSSSIERAINFVFADTSWHFFAHHLPETEAQTLLTIGGSLIEKGRALCLTSPFIEGVKRTCAERVVGHRGGPSITVRLWCRSVQHLAQGRAASRPAHLAQDFGGHHGRSEPVVDVHDRHATRARVEHGQQRRDTAESRAVPAVGTSVGWHVGMWACGLDTNLRQLDFLGLPTITNTRLTLQPQ